MKKFGAFLTAALLVLTSVTAFAACGKSGGKYENKEDTLYIVSINKGYGVQWLRDIAERFKATHEGIDVNVTAVYDDGVTKNTLESGAAYCNYDLMFTGLGKNIAAGSFLADLTDVYNSTLSGRTQTVEDSLDPTLKAAFKNIGPDGKAGYNVMAWTQGVNGLLINYEAATKALGAGWEQNYPLRTTNELIAFAAAIKGAGKNAFGHCANTHYYQFVYDTWWAQYEGIAGLTDYYNGIYSIDDGDGGTLTGEGPEVALQQGRLESLKVMESIFAPSPAGGLYSHPKSNGITWETMQTYFMLGEFVMLSNGDWNNLEMSKSFPNTDVRFIKLPIVSALGAKLGLDENTLGSVIDYVDAGQTGAKPSASDEAIAAVAESRRFSHTYADAHTLAIPSYSKKIDLAKDFIKLLLSDEGQQIYAKATGGLTAGYGFDYAASPDYASASPFAKSRWQIAKDVRYYLFPEAKFSSLNSFSAARRLAPMPVLLSRDTDRKTAQWIYEYEYGYYKEQWANLVATANQKASPV
ncbi:MAG: extracellular solute-binding protein [Clostridiales bacterium]|jgi:ABC-type glycerol-3-phosphate transport system substrate-binding protein|nr:extracellular solute-binding protein [Clostridiales bacterium]